MNAVYLKQMTEIFDYQGNFPLNVAIIKFRIYALYVTKHLDAGLTIGSRKPSECQTTVFVDIL